MLDGDIEAAAPDAISMLKVRLTVCNGLVTHVHLQPPTSLPRAEQGVVPCDCSFRSKFEYRYVKNLTDDIR